MARTLAVNRHIICASPDYRARVGAPLDASALKDHACLLYSNRDPNPAWTLSSVQGTRSYRVKAVFRSNNGELLRDAAVAGVGIAMLPRFIAGAHLDKGLLIPVLEHYHAPDGAISAVYPPARHVPNGVRQLIAHLAPRIQSLPWL